MLELFQWWHELPARVNDAIIIIGGMVVFFTGGMMCHLYEQHKTKH
jgi:hypothetical protein